MNLTLKRALAVQLVKQGRFEQAREIIAENRRLGSNVLFDTVSVGIAEAILRGPDDLDPALGEESLISLHQLSGEDRENLLEGSIEILEMLLGDPGARDAVSRTLAAFQAGDAVDDFLLMRKATAARDGTSVGLVLTAMLDQGPFVGWEAPLVMAPALVGAERIFQAPEYVEVWRRPEMQRYAKVRLARGVTAGIPPQIIAELEAGGTP